MVSTQPTALTDSRIRRLVFLLEKRCHTRKEHRYPSVDELEWELAGHT
jgi:hypothetical protein